MKAISFTDLKAMNEQRSVEFEARLNAAGKSALVGFYNAHYTVADCDEPFDESDLSGKYGRLVEDVAELECRHASELVADGGSQLEIGGYYSRSGNPVCLSIRPEYFDWFSNEGAADE